VTEPLRIGVLASGEGTTLQAILDACKSGRLDARVVVVISNNSDAGALRRARAANVTTLHLSGKTHPDPSGLDSALTDGLLRERSELVLLAGYMKKLGPRLLAEFRGRVLNTHPSLLPKHGGHGMYGMRVHEAVLAAGEQESGASVHLVDGDYDTGPVIAQARVAVEPGDTAPDLASRVQEQERRLVVSVLSGVASGEIAVEGLTRRQ